MKYNLSKASKDRLSTCHIDLQKIINKAISWSDVDFGVSEGHRTIKRQHELYLKGASRIDGITTKGKHNYTPSLAVDVYAYFNNKAQWDAETITYIMGIVKGASEFLYECGETTHKIRWGGNWDMDGVILIDQSFDDLPHHELKNI